jgi:GNAT superfamily N-acetyltransferase
MLSIRPATVEDAPLLDQFSRELAVYDRKPDAVLIGVDALVRDGFGPQPKFRALIADWNAQSVGYALFFGFYSSWRGPGLFLEDLFVRETFRNRGIGRALLRHVAGIARREGCYGMRWEALAWNEPVLKFYKSLGGEFLDEWRQVLLDTEALARLADG